MSERTPTLDGFIEENISTLRDQFAIAALPALQADADILDTNVTARLAYEMADAMLAERNKEPLEKLDIAALLTSVRTSLNAVATYKDADRTQLNHAIGVIDNALEKLNV
jgi:hypothetical protein